MLRALRRNASRGLALLVTAVLLAIGLTGCSPGAKTSMADIPMYKIGEPITLNLDETTVEAKIMSATYTTRQLGERASPKSPRNGRFVVLDVVWKSTKGRTHVSFARLRAIDSSGDKTGRVIYADNWLDSGEVLEGESLRGLVIFDVVESGPVDITFHDVYQREVARVKVHPTAS